MLAEINFIIDEDKNEGKLLPKKKGKCSHIKRRLAQLDLTVISYFVLKTKDNILLP